MKGNLSESPEFGGKMDTDVQLAPGKPGVRAGAAKASKRAGEVSTLAKPTEK